MGDRRALANVPRRLRRPCHALRRARDPRRHILELAIGGAALRRRDRHRRTRPRGVGVPGSRAPGSLMAHPAHPDLPTPDRGRSFTAEGAPEILPPMLPGDWIGDRFEIERLAGKGGMGEVYRARDRQTGDMVAV